jgi:hypothetical protein
MTNHERAIYDRMSPRQRKAIDALRPENRSAALTVFERVEQRQVRRHESTRMQPDRTNLAPADFQDPDDSDRRHP